MMTLNLLIILIPILSPMGALWVQCGCMDNLPKHAFEEKRKTLRWGMIFLILTLIYTATATYLAVEMIQTEYNPPMIHATLQLSE